MLLEKANRLPMLPGVYIMLDDKGEVDAEASRRVEILFRLKDEDMIREMIEILSSQGAQDEASDGAN